MGPSTRIGNYELVRPLGRGGMGVVWHARDPSLERDVAIKMIVPEKDDDVARENAARFLVEARVAANIRSKHVAHVIELGSTPEGAAYFVMELLEGETLLTLLNRERRLDASRAIRLARQIARGMTAAHALDIVHRDLKPGNVMLVTLDGEREVVKIFDFGLAKRTSDTITALTQQGAVLGTLQYMAPEQLRGHAVDGRADIFALGVVLYRMLTGRAPFAATSLAEMLDRQLTVRPPRPSSVVDGIAPALDDIVMRCLEKERDDRFATMADLESALASAASAAVSLAPRFVAVDITDEEHAASAHETYDDGREDFDPDAEENRASADEEDRARAQLLAPLSDPNLVEPPALTVHGFDSAPLTPAPLGAAELAAVSAERSAAVRLRAEREHQEMRFEDNRLEDTRIERPERAPKRNAAVIAVIVVALVLAAVAIPLLAT